MPTLLDARVLEDALHRLSSWSGDPSGIRRTVHLDDRAAAEFERLIAVTARSLNHDPDVQRSNGQTTVVLRTSSVGGVSELDVAMASRIDDHVRTVTGAEPKPLPEEVTSAVQVVTTAGAEGQSSPAAGADTAPASSGPMMGVPAGSQGTVTPGVAMPDTAPNEPQPGANVEQEAPDRIAAGGAHDQPEAEESAARGADTGSGRLDRPV